MDICTFRLQKNQKLVFASYVCTCWFSETGGDVGLGGSYLAHRFVAAANLLASASWSGHDGLVLSQIVGVDPSGQPETFWRMLVKLAPLRSNLSKRMDESKASPAGEVRRGVLKKVQKVELLRFRSSGFPRIDKILP